MRSNPFKEGADPLLFPFLILEAKKEDGVGFESMLTQTCFPIWALLKLQEDQQEQVTDPDPGVSPFVWFFGSRGDSWRVYGCYITEDEPVKYVSLLLSPPLQHRRLTKS